MHHNIIGTRTASPVFVVLPTSARMGDLAIYRTVLNEWRASHPDDRLVICRDPCSRKTEYSKYLPTEWVFSMADEVWVKNKLGEPWPVMPGPEAKMDGEYLRHWFMWRKWPKLRGGIHHDTKVDIAQSVKDAADARLKAAGLTGKFALIHPLMDAGYHVYRNAPGNWWAGVAAHLVKSGVPTGVILSHAHERLIKLPPGVASLFTSSAELVTVLTIVSKASVLVGGETGIPLWACLLKVPIAAAFRTWGMAQADDRSGQVDFRPIPFNAPVVYASLNNAPEAAADAAKGLFDGSITVSTKP